jgi:hypothetical protein
MRTQFAFYFIMGAAFLLQVANAVAGVTTH